MAQDYTILLVSDEESDLVVIDYVLRESLSRACVVKRAATPPEAEMLLAAGRFDLCLADAGEGNGRGLEFARCQRRHNPQVPVILLTDGEDQALDQEVAAAGAVDFLPKGRFHAWRLARTARMAIERQSLIGRINRLERYDELTGLAKKDISTERLAQMLALGQRNELQGVLALFRLTDLEEILMSFGPSMADYVLVRMAGRLTENVREADLIGRWDRETFAVIGGNVGSAEAAGRFSAKIVRALEEPVRLEKTDIVVPVTASLVLWPGQGDDAAALIEMAEAGLDAPAQPVKTAI